MFIQKDSLSIWKHLEISRTFEIVFEYPAKKWESKREKFTLVVLVRGRFENIYFFIEKSLLIDHGKA